MTRVDKIITACATRGIMLTPTQGEQLAVYMTALLEKNRYINMTRIVEEEAFIEKNIVDSLMLTLQQVSEPKKILDLGTGGGFPGVPLAIYYPHARVTLVDGTAKKLRVVSEICEEIGLKNLTTVHARGEVLGHDKNHREQYDWVAARAVANMAVLSELCLPFVRKGGFFLAMKGENYKDELSFGETSISQKGGKVQAVTPYFLLQRQVTHVIIRVVKEKNTPARYPRSYKKINEQYGAVKKQIN